MNDQPGLHRTITRVLSTAMVLIGVVLVVRAVAEGGGPLSTGVIAGVLFVAAGSGRIWMSTRSR